MSWTLSCPGKDEPAPERPTNRNCWKLYEGLIETSHYPLYPVAQENSKIASDHGVRVRTRTWQNLHIETTGVTGATHQGSLTRDENNPNRLSLNGDTAPVGPAVRISRATAEKRNEEALAELDRHNRDVATYAILSEASNTKKTGNGAQTESKYTKEVLDELAKTAEKNWDATQVSVRQIGADGKPGDIVGTARVFSSGIDRRLAPYPEFLKNFLRTYKGKGKWRVGLVDASLTRPLVLENVLNRNVENKHVEVERPILDIPEGLTLPNGETIYFLVGEAKEIGAFAVPKDLPDKAVYRSIMQALLTEIFQTDLPTDYRLHGQLFYGGCNSDLVGYWEKMGWDRLNVGKPILMAGDAPGKTEDYWIVRRTAESFSKWIDQIANKPEFGAKEAEKLRKLFTGLSDQGLTERQREIWAMYYVERKSQTEIAEELGLTRGTVNVTISAANDKIELRLGLKVPPSPIRLDDIIFAADTPAKKRRLEKAIAEADLTDRQAEMVALKMKGLSNSAIARELDIYPGHVGVTLAAAQGKIESQLGGAFPIELRPFEFQYRDYSQALGEPKAGESQDIKDLREAVYGTDLEDVEKEILYAMREGKSLQEIADDRGVTRIATRASLHGLAQKVEEYEADGERAPVWKRLLTPEGKTKLEAASKRVERTLTERQKEIWNLYFHKGESFAEIGRILGLKSNSVRKSVESTKQKIEIELGEKDDTSRITIANIVEAADTPKKKQELKAAIKAAEKTLTEKQMEIWKLYFEKGVSSHKLEKDLGYDITFVADILIKMKHRILKGIGDDFEIRENRVAGIYKDLIDATKETPQEGESEKAKKIRAAFAHMQFGRVQLLILQRFREGKSPEQIDEEVGNLHSHINQLQQRVDEEFGKPGPKDISPWGRLLTEKEREEMRIAVEASWPTMTEYQRNVWTAYTETTDSFTEIAEQLDSTMMKVNTMVSVIKAKIERNWPQKISDGDGTPWEKVLVPEDQARLDKAVKKIAPKLTDRQKVILDLFYNQKMDGEQIAVKLKLTPGTARYDLRKIKELIEETLKAG